MNKQPYSELAAKTRELIVAQTVTIKDQELPLFADVPDSGMFEYLTPGADGAEVARRVVVQLIFVGSFAGHMIFDVRRWEGARLEHYPMALTERYSIGKIAVRNVRW